MEKLKYTVADSTIAYLLGVNNFINDESAILELVKNAYDANSSSLTIEIEDDSISLIDDGIGMNYTDIVKNWMNVGSSDKGYDIEDKNGGRRVLAGAKGVGRFALARLGKEIVLDSRKEGEKGIRWTTDWNNSYVDIRDCDFYGTHIEVKKLNKNWDRKAIDSLISFLNLAFIDERMQLRVKYHAEEIELHNTFSSSGVGIDCLSEIELNYDCSARLIRVSIFSDEFLEEASEYTGENIREKESLLKAKDECARELKNSIPDDVLDKLLQELGDFSAKFLFRFKPNTVDKERFLYKHLNLPEVLSMNGIFLYRNAFSIATYDGKRDWLGLGKRSRESPAAATHPTGSWRVRENQITGFVLIDKEKNKVLKELSNRQGIEENSYYHVFLSIIRACFGEFERYRQGIIRDINKKNDEPIAEQGIQLAKMVIANPEMVLKFNKIDAEQLADELTEIIDDGNRFRAEKEESEQKLQYDVRILNVLATIGLKASSVAHQFKNDRSKLSANISFAIDALKEYGFWEQLLSPQCTEHEYKNVPYLLNSINDSSRKIMTFVDIMLSDIEKKRFQSSVICIAEEIKRIAHDWESDYKWITISCSVPDDYSVKMPEDILQVILDNLILNSIQQNDLKEKLLISINVEKHNESCFLLSYSDNGVGLAEKYKDNPRRILEVHETTRKNGHGLGMWIVNNTVVMSGGQILNIGTSSGFSIQMTING